MVNVEGQAVFALLPVIVKNTRDFSCHYAMIFYTFTDSRTKRHRMCTQCFICMEGEIKPSHC